MSDPEKIPSGEPTESPADEPKATESEDKTVSYESHRKLLSEKKALAAKYAENEVKLATYEQEKNEAEEKRLKDNEEWKTFAEKKDAEAKEATAKLAARESQISEAQKLDAFLNVLDGNVDRKYWTFIDTESIVKNPDTGEIDDMSVAKAVENFKANYSEIIHYPGQKTGLPNESPKPKGQSITLEEWKKLPANEMRARYNEMMEGERANKH